LNEAANAEKVFIIHTFNTSSIKEVH